VTARAARDRPPASLETYMVIRALGRKRIRKFFGKIREVAEMPNLIEVQKASYDQFLMAPVGRRPNRTRIKPAVTARAARDRPPASLETYMVGPPARGPRARGLWSL
jgi:DNA-directed RNA polymerase beta subunit